MKTVCIQVPCNDGNLYLYKVKNVPSLDDADAKKRARIVLASHFNMPEQLLGVTIINDGQAIPTNRTISL